MDIYFLNPSRALRILAKKNSITGLRATGNVMTKQEFPKLAVKRMLIINKSRIALAGPVAQEKGHGIAVKDHFGWLFLETDYAELQTYLGNIVK